MMSAKCPFPRLLVLALLESLIALTACDAGDINMRQTDSGQNAAETQWKAQIVQELENRSFRQFHPAKDANPRQGVILGFSRGISLWAQYAQEGHAINEWEISAESYSIEGKVGSATVTVYFDEPSSTQEFPTLCDDCIQTEGLSISIRDVFDSEKISFRLNDPERVLPSPFPVFASWTRFEEDEYIE